jgi:hypothetical protein
MRCDEAVRWIDATVGGTVPGDEVGLAPETEGELLAHVRACAACARLRDETRDAAEITSEWFLADVLAERARDESLAADVAARLRTGRVLRFPRWASKAAVALVAVSLGFAWNAWRTPSAPAVTPETYRLFPPRPEGYGGPRFDDVTVAAGIQNVDHTGLAGQKDWMVETVGHGAVAFDMDADGDLDLFVPDGNRVKPEERVSGTWRLYRNDGGMRFTDVTAGSGLDADSWGSGAVAGDVDGDGLADVFVPCFGKNHLFRNLGGGRFEDVTARAGVAGDESEWSTAAAMGDLDGDGDLDLYVANYADMRRYMVEARRGRDCTWRSMPVACGPSPLDAQRDRVFLNRGDGTFADATETAMPLFRRYSFQPVILDFDRDGRLDVYVACDAQPNLLFRNLGGGRFEEIGMSVGAATDGTGREQASMGLAAGDVDDDGRIDLFVTNFSHESNCLYRNLGVPGTLFGDVTSSASLEAPSHLTLGWGSSFSDIDNDGDLDLLYANGHLYPGVERNVPETTYAQHVAVMQNDGAGRFREVTSGAGETVRPRVHRGLVVADLDDDGASDLFLTVLNDRAVLLRNDGRGVGKSVRFLLRGRGGRVEAAGASLEADVADVPGRTRIVRDLALGSSFGSGEDPRLSVGLGDAGSVTAVRVRWPYDGTTPVLPPEGERGFEPGATYEVVQGLPRARRAR